MRNLVSAILLALGLTLAVAPAALACGDTPGFCPNPPTCQDTGNINIC